jgi:hypothetical protein
VKIDHASARNGSEREGRAASLSRENRGAARGRRRAPGAARGRRRSPRAEEQLGGRRRRAPCALAQLGGVVARREPRSRSGASSSRAWRSSRRRRSPRAEEQLGGASSLAASRGAARGRRRRAPGAARGRRRSPRAEEPLGGVVVARLAQLAAPSLAASLSERSSEIRSLRCFRLAALGLRDLRRKSGTSPADKPRHGAPPARVGCRTRPHSGGFLSPT